MSRFFVDQSLSAQHICQLPPHAVRHAQSLRKQPGDVITLFNGNGHEWSATILAMGRNHIEAQILQGSTPDRELPCAVTLAVVPPANERMDWLIEKATELGAFALQPLSSARSVVRLEGERALKRQAHWQAIAVSATEQCGRTRVPKVESLLPLTAWLEQTADVESTHQKWIFSLDASAQPLSQRLAQHASLNSSTFCFLSGPEGGFTPQEEALALQLGWQAVNLGPRTLRAETAPLAALAALAVFFK